MATKVCTLLLACSRSKIGSRGNRVERARRWLCIWLLALGVGSTAVADTLQFKSKEDSDRYVELIEELRCPKCLNTNLAGSDAPIARDLRETVYELVVDGKSNAEIRTFMQERYGDFILYAPPLKPSTLVLWVFPVLLFLLVLWIVLKVGVRSERIELTDDEKQRLKRLTKS